MLYLINIECSLTDRAAGCPPFPKARIYAIAASRKCKSINNRLIRLCPVSAGKQILSVILSRFVYQSPDPVIFLIGCPVSQFYLSLSKPIVKSTLHAVTVHKIHRTLLIPLKGFCLLQVSSHPVRGGGNTHGIIISHLHRQPDISGICKIISVTSVTHIDEFSIFSIHGENTGTLCPEGDILLRAHTGIPLLLPWPQRRICPVVNGSIGIPSRTAGGHQIIFSLILEHCRSFPGTSRHISCKILAFHRILPYCQIRIVFIQPGNIKSGIFLTGIEDIRRPVIILEQIHISCHSFTGSTVVL